MIPLALIFLKSFKSKKTMFTYTLPTLPYEIKNRLKFGEDVTEFFIPETFLTSVGTINFWNERSLRFNHKGQEQIFDLEEFEHHGEKRAFALAKSSNYDLPHEGFEEKIKIDLYIHEDNVEVWCDKIYNKLSEYFKFQPDNFKESFTDLFKQSNIEKGPSRVYLFMNNYHGLLKHAVFFIEHKRMIRKVISEVRCGVEDFGRVQEMFSMQSEISSYIQSSISNIKVTY